MKKNLPYFTLVAFCCLVLAVLKIEGKFCASWFWVFYPFWLPAGLITLFVLIGLLFNKNN